jgi:hypothetical protein
MIREFKYELYQHVKHQLAFWAWLIIYTHTIWFYLTVLTTTDKSEIQLAIQTHLGIGIGVVLIAIPVSAVIALVLVYLWQVHDRIYDRYVIGWRFKHDCLFIIPELISPFWDRIPPGLLETVRENRTIKEMFMSEAFYFFTGDDSGKVGQNTIRRFYVAVTGYWVTQILELILLLSLIAYVVVGTVKFGILNLPMTFPLTIIAMLIVNRILFVPRSRRYTEEMTHEEIREIHRDHIQELRNKINDLMRNMDLMRE